MAGQPLDKWLEEKKLKHGTTDVWTRLHVENVLLSWKEKKEAFKAFGENSKGWSAPCKWADKLADFNGELKDVQNAAGRCQGRLR